MIRINKITLYKCVEMKRIIHSVLLVDDNDATNYLNRILLEQCAFARHIYTASNGLAALDHISGRKREKNYGPPHLIFVDGVMPLLDGWELIGEIERQKWSISFVPIVVMLTSCGCPEKKKEALQHKFVLDYLEKPLTKEMIMEVRKKLFFWA